MNEFFHNNYVQIVGRCIAVYFFVVIAIRIFGKKELAQLSVTDLVFILLISNAVQNAMVGPDTTLVGGIIAAFSLFLLNYLMKQLLYRNKRVNKLLQGTALTLVYKGQLNEQALRNSEITIDELLAAIREHGVEELRHVDLAVLEIDGNISVISDDFTKQTSHDITKVHAKRKHRFRGRLNNP